MNFSYWFNTSAYPSLELTFALVGSVSWALVYYLLIRNARRRGFMEMPLLGGAGNVAWAALFSFVFAEHINLGMAFVWGVRVCFLMSGYIFYRALNTFSSEVLPPLIRRYIAPIGIVLVVIWGIFIGAIVQSGLDNVPFGTPSSVTLGGVSAYILNVVISVLFIVQYVRLYAVHVFSKGVAWSKMIAAAVTTIFFALVDPQNILLLTMGGIVFMVDVCYIALMYIVPSFSPRQSTDENRQNTSIYANHPLLTFPSNPAFDEHWARNPVYFEMSGYRLRKLQLPHWCYTSSQYRHEGFVLEGLIVCSIDEGECSADVARALSVLTDSILREMNLYGKPLYFFTDARAVRKTDAEARAIINKSYETIFRGVRLFLVTNDALRLVVRLLRVFVSERWQLFSTPEKALEALLASLPSIPRMSSLTETTEPIFPVNPTFDALWKQNPEYLECRGHLLRKLQLPHWRFIDAGYHRESFVLEGAILCNIDSGDCTGGSVRNCLRLADSITKEMNMSAGTLFFIENTLGVGKVSAEARRVANQGLTTNFRGLHLFLVTTELTRIAFRLVRPFSPEAYRNWRLFASFEDALVGMLRTHFIPSSDLEVSREISTTATEQEHQTISTAFHEQRIDELYTILAKIAYNDFDTIPTPVLPEHDLYADIFKALSIVMEDKRLQIEQVLAQKGQLEEQAVHIQLVNTELSQQNDDLAALNREKSEIMGIVAHDLKNPIGAIRGLAELIESGFADTSKVPEIATQIVRTANRMLDLVKNILDSNQLEEGAMHFHRVHVDLAPLVDSVVAQYSSAAQYKNITIHREIEQHEIEQHEIEHNTTSHRDCSTLAIADEQAVMQVFENLLSNAVKYSPYGKNIFVRLSSNAHVVRFEVQDEGEGISSEDMKKLFEKFARLSAQPTGGEHSTGLGLSIVKKMVEAMDGRVWCESELGKGARFVVELPSASSSDFATSVIIDT